MNKSADVIDSVVPQHYSNCEMYQNTHTKSLSHFFATPKESVKNENSFCLTLLNYVWMEMLVRSVFAVFAFSVIKI